jgi:acyl-CoA synthetase (NDP forming)
MSLDPKPLMQILDAAAREGRFSLLEPEVYRFLSLAGCKVPRSVLLRPGEHLEDRDLYALGARTGQVVLKVVSPEIAHKTDVGGVVKVPAEEEQVRRAMERMFEHVPERFASTLEARPGHAPRAYRELEGERLRAAIRADLRGVLVVERVPLEERGPGSEVLFGLRHNREFGPVLTMGLGGVDTELLGEACRKGTAVVSGSALLLEEEALLGLLRPTLSYRRLAGLTREGHRLVEDAAILRLIRAFRTVAQLLGSDEGEGAGGFVVTELEVNPFAAAEGDLVALDGLLKFRPRRALPAPRPLASLGPLLRPKSVGIIGVSAKGMNMGRIILRNLVGTGFDKSRATIVRPDEQEIDGVRCVPSVRDLPEKVDLFVVVVGAEQVPDLVQELADSDKATGVILIPGGMAEKEGGAAIEHRLKSAISRARGESKDLVVCGGNCLGIVSRPGSYHTIFIPPEKLVLREDGRSNVAFISQSGAYMVSRMSKLSWLSPRYAISTGNQSDLTVGDFLRHLLEDQAVQTFAVYVEGFQDHDGLDFARAVARVTSSGRDVIFYKAGRTPEGKTASSGHTASLAGDYEVCEAIIRHAGAHVARTFTEFLDLTKISSLMGDRPWAGRRLGALSNAGFEAVGIADNLHGESWNLELAPLSPETRRRLAEALARGHLDTLVDVRNPLDLTPMAGDQPHEEAVRAFLEAAEVDLVLCATVPLTPAMATLGEEASEDASIRSPGSLVHRLARLLPEVKKPLVASLDSGSLYDPMCRALEEIGIPTFRSADVAVRTMGLFAEGRLARTGAR